MGVVALAELVTLRQTWRHSGQQLVLTNGVFDLLHIGHITYLQQARALGDVLVVGLNSDSSTRAIKGPQRPLVPEEARAHMLAALRCVDYVTIFAQPTAEALAAAVQPDMYVKGGDYATTAGSTDSVNEDRLPEARVVRSTGGRVVLLAYQEGYSTSALIERIVQLQRGGGCL